MRGTDDPTTAPAADPRGFGLATATFVVVSSMVGVGILTTSGYTVLDVGSHGASLVLWTIGGGLGMGMRDFRIVFLFRNQAALDRFVEAGWEFSLTSAAGAQTSDRGATAQATAATTPDSPLTTPMP